MNVGFVVALAFILVVDAHMLKSFARGDISAREAGLGAVAGGMFLALCL